MKSGYSAPQPAEKQGPPPTPPTARAEPKDGGTVTTARHTYKHGLWSNNVTEMLDFKVKSPYGLVEDSQYRRKEAGASGWLQQLKIL
ncbi:MAG: hypothetical protein KF760_15160 [Candidatus Eremiobacteraeota bacterium]|nr:hypothetical protein [Candidatus Eremiobacteraeota bacterium]